MTDAELEDHYLREPRLYVQAVYARYASPLLGFIYRFTRNQQASEELLHEIFLELLAGKFRYVDQGTLKSWLFTLAKNKGLNHLRKNERICKADLLTTFESESMENSTIQQNLLTRLTQLETHLPSDLAQTWSLRKAGLDYQEIAQALQIPLGTVKSRFSRLVEFLRKEF